MPDTDIAQTIVGDITEHLEDYTVPPETTDGPDGTTEHVWQMEDWQENLGYYKKIPELRVAIDTKVNWTIGAGIEADPLTLLHTSMIKGNGKDTFTTILENQARVAKLAGDSYAEIITNDEGIILNLKPLDPSTIAIISDKKGRIKRYEQRFKKKTIHKFQPNEVFHLSHDRIADEVHGNSIVNSVKWIILARNEAMDDWKTVLHRNVKGLMVHYVDTDDDAKIDAYEAKANKARGEGNDLIVPKGTVEIELIQKQLNQSVSPLQWIDQLNNYFFQAVNVPQIVVGNASEFTDASAKIAYLAFEQSVKTDQLYLEEQVLEQLSFEIRLTFPASLQQDTITSNPETEDQLGETPDQSNADPLQAGEPNDTTAELEGRS